MSPLNINGSSADDKEEFYGNKWVCQIIAGEAVCGFLGNILVCFVILRVKFLHNMTNYLLVNLAVADMFLCLVTFIHYLAADAGCRLVIYVPASIPGKELFCRFFASGYLSWALIYVTSYSLCAVSLERYIAIVHPLHYATKLAPAKIRRLIALIWMAPFLLALPVVFLNGPSLDPDEACAGIRYPTQAYPVVISVFTFLSAYLLPIVSMGWAYYTIQITLKRQAQSLHCRQAKDAAYDLVIARQRVVSMLTIVLGALIILWTPGYLSSLVCFHPTQDESVSSPLCSSRTYFIVRGICDFFFYFNSVINPIIYEFKYKKFQQGLKVAFCCGCSDGRGTNRVHVQMVPV